MGRVRGLRLTTSRGSPPPLQHLHPLSREVASLAPIAAPAAVPGRRWRRLCAAGLCSLAAATAAPSLVPGPSPARPAPRPSAALAASPRLAEALGRRQLRATGMPGACPSSASAGSGGVRRGGPALRAVNEAGFDIGVSMPPEEAEKMGIQPFGDGGADNSTSPRPKIYSHGPCASPAAAQFIVKCSDWRDTSPGDARQRELAEKALEVLRTHGFVILEELLPADYVAPLEPEAAQYLGTSHDGFIPQPLRANRSQLHLPYAMPWASDWLVKHDLVLELVARYVRNDLAGGRTQDEQQWGLVQWLTSGADLDWFLSPEWGPKPGRLWDAPPTGCSGVGSPEERGPWLGRVMVTKTPPGSPPQKHHRDINFPGPTAQLTIQVALTPLEANNGPLGYVPGSHRMVTPGFEVVANPPLGSAVLYDSFVEHHGIENHSPRDRYAMYYEFETRGIFGGYTDEHFGPQAAAHTMAFRMAIDPELRQWVERVRAAA
mmetsp:Transcript_31080/g.92479  ORF Transcript_31080/g.92479 Transcript_31080/m.92479 type:complete len:489 (+) Transcript_31080:44-1510(+)